MQKLLSIIIPVYKVEPYINKCLDSLIIASELMEKMDVLVINDGTPDRSAELSREYVKRFPGIFRQIDQENVLRRRFLWVAPLSPFLPYFHTENAEWQRSKMAVRFKQNSPIIFYLI